MPTFDFSRPFYFLRHGETHWNRERRIQGQIDSALSPDGLAQAGRAAAVLASRPIRRIVASPLSRARITAEKAGAALGLAVETDDALMECHLGEHQGTYGTDFLAGYWTGDYDPPGGESFAVFRDRVLGAIARIAAEGPDTLIVAHGGLWHALRQTVAIEPDLERMPNALPLHLTPGEPWTARLLDTPSGPTIRTA